MFFFHIDPSRKTKEAGGEAFERHQMYFSFFRANYYREHFWSSVDVYDLNHSVCGHQSVKTDVTSRLAVCLSLFYPTRIWMSLAKLDEFIDTQALWENIVPCHVQSKD